MEEKLESHEDKVLTLDPEELNFLKDLKNKTERAAMENRILELEYKNAIQSIYLKYQLDVMDIIDIATGKITKNKKEEV
jgi:hypothetical protein